MMPRLAALTIVAYVWAVVLFWRDRTFRPLLLLIAGSIATLSQPLWSRLFGLGPDVPGNVIRFGTVAMIPFWTVLGGGVLLALPALVIMYGLRHGWFNQHYLSAWGFFLAFALFFLIVQALEARSGIRLFARPQIPQFPRAEPFMHALLLSGISFGLLYAFVSTRHFSLGIALLPVLLSGLAASLLLIGILSSPFWLARLFEQDRVLLAAVGISAVLVLWAVHLLAGGLHASRHQRLQWR